MASLRPSSVKGDPIQFSPFSAITNSFTGFHRNWLGLRTEKLGRVDNTWLRLSPSLKEKSVLRLDASSISAGLAQELQRFKIQNMSETDGRVDFFDEMKHRFLSFKKQKYLGEVEHFKTLAEVQSPKFMVIACVDSRVCPSNILGFQPGEAFMVRNVANLVPPLENGRTETNAALEFAVKTLQVQNIFVIGHSCCAGIQTLMTMQDDENSSFIEKWVANAKVAKLRTKEAINLSFDQQCKHCEKESINCSLLNLLTYPWIEERVRKGTLSLQGGYYDFLRCTFEIWTLDFKESNVSHGSKISVKDKAFWC
ncbi:beta carbonic anhydrase 5, chloroplastic-like isoform X2 [Populus nigra]|nr:beta carbonic anhydrase 5, chloroplastic-like isoform X2 [Populus nigra]XP_061973304.1 beta carbonic anhydrase 5, chloroplastic-like isoform X2 [Populus nigra]